MISKKDMLTLTVAQIDQLIADAQSARVEVEKRVREDVLRQIRETAAEAGFDLNDLVGSQAMKPRKPARYRNPENPVQPWSGRGRRPGWFIAYEEKGGDPEDLEV